MSEKTKIAVIGGGVSALTAVYALTSTEALRAKYDVTIYQFGHRLGGKGASGRNLDPDKGKRIEEHGLHIWFGFYENAFKWMRDCYKELGRTEGPIQTWEQAFHKHSYFGNIEFMQSGPVPWMFLFPTNTDIPGDGGELPSLHAYVEMALEWLIKGIDAYLDDRAPSDAPHDLLSRLEDLASRCAEHLAREPVPPKRASWHGTVIPPDPMPPARHPVSRLLMTAYAVLRSLDDDLTSRSTAYHPLITSLIKGAMDLAWHDLKEHVETDISARKAWVLINLTGSAVCGALDAPSLERFNDLDQWSLDQWLRKYGANEVTLGSSLVRGIYDLLFGYVKDESTRPSLGAGTALRGVLRMLFTYKGAFMFRMEAGMGDIVAAPFYEVLKRRGVKFRFFHRVNELGVEGDKVTRITVTKQVKLKDESEEYRPLIDVGGLPCWPSTPLYDQIEGGDEIARDPLINFESSWSAPWKDETKMVLEVGKDFDQVILAASIAALADIAKPMLDANPALKTSVERVRTRATQALQLWLSKTTTDLGWVRPKGVNEGPVVGAYVELLDTWADMSDLLPREAWAPPIMPRSIAYFCGTWDETKPIPPFSDHQFPEQELKRCQDSVHRFMSEELNGLLPSYTAGDVVSMYTRVNIEPTERYVLSVEGTVQYRLRADQSGFANVVLCGDWTLNGLNAGCVEAAVMSGLLASNAICGFPAASEIIGAGL
jgi:uncharacterized protein with NAD-binding domain and iron-sulfur cluster